MDISSIFSSRDSIEFLVRQFMSLEEAPRTRILQSKDLLSNRKSILSELDSRLSTLQTKAERLNDKAFNYFGAKKAGSSDSEKISVSAGFAAGLGNHAISVSRLASSDTRVSDQFTDSSNSFAAFSGDQTFTIEVGHPTEADQTNRVQISVTVSGSLFSQTDDKVLEGISNAIDAAMDAAVTAGTIENDEVVRASVVSEENGKSRMVLRSDKSGFTHRMAFGSSNLLDKLNVNLNSQTVGTSGGFIKDPGTTASDSVLNASFEVDGLTFYRDSNTVTDALEGLSLQLRAEFASPETITVSADKEAVRKEIQDFLDAYNEVVDYLRDGSRGGEQRGALADDVVYRDLLNDLRGITTGTVTGTLTSNYDRLFNIGIESDSTGKLVIKDVDKLNTALETNSQYVSDLFNNDTGYAARLETFVEGYVKANGTISNSKNNIDNQISTLDSRLNLLNELLTKREDQLRNELSQMQSAMTRLVQQQAFFGSLNSGFGF